MASKGGRWHVPGRPAQALVAYAGAVPRAAWIGAAIVVVVATCGVLLDRSVGPATRANPRFQLTPERLVVQPPPPPWVGRDLREEVMVQGNLVGLNLLERGTVRAVWRAFELNPWVRRVKFVGKRAEGRVYIELSYRRPIAMVSAPDGWYPVDTDGVVLPSEDFDPSDPQRFVEIVTPYPEPIGDVGTSFGRPGVVGASQIATLLAGQQRAIGLRSIHVAYRDVTNEGRPQFELRTRNGSIIVWGSAPGKELRDEAQARQKTRRLAQLAATREAFSDSSTSRWIDVRTGLIVRPIARPVSSQR